MARRTEFFRARQGGVCGAGRWRCVQSTRQVAFIYEPHRRQVASTASISGAASRDVHLMTATRRLMAGAAVISPGAGPQGRSGETGWQPTRPVVVEPSTTARKEGAAQCLRTPLPHLFHLSGRNIAT